MTWSHLVGEEAVFTLKACHKCWAAVVVCVEYRGLSLRNRGRILEEELCDLRSERGK